MISWCWWRTAHKTELKQEAIATAARWSKQDNEQRIIDSIFSIRVRNNIPWKCLIEIAMKHAPDETKAALRDINANDRAISDLMTELAK